MHARMHMHICVRACCALQGRVGVCIQRIQAGFRREDGEEEDKKETNKCRGGNKKKYMNMRCK